MAKYEYSDGDIASVFEEDSEWSSQGSALASDEIEALDKTRKAEEMSAKKGLKKVKDDIIIFGSIIKEHFNGTYTVANGTLVAMLAALAYVVFPLDVIPDFIPILGLSDDVGVMGVAVAKCKTTIDEYKKYKGIS